MRAFFLALLISVSGWADGWVKDASGRPVAGARVVIFTAGSGAMIGEVRTGDNGAFAVDAARPPFRLRITAPGLADREVTVLPGAAMEFVLEPATGYQSVTVSAAPTLRGIAEESGESPQVAIVRTRERLAEQPLPTIGHALAEQPGVLLQQSTWGQASPFLRGLTGYQVLNLVDGIRFNNSTFRSGPNQYLAYVEPSQAQRVEAVLGPTSVAWGSDALGGAINIVTAPPSFLADGGRPALHGEFGLGAASADLSGSAQGRLTLSTPRFYWMGSLAGRRHNDLRPGGGVDSRNVYRRFFGLSNQQIGALVGNRQQDSGYQQYGAEARVSTRWRPDQLVTLHYQRGAQQGVDGYKDLLGGLGRVISTFEPQTLDWFYGRYEKLQWGWVDSASGTFSFNRQTDGGRRQNLSFSDPLTTDYARVNVLGYSGQATTHVGPRLLASFGGDVYDEHVDATREVRNPVTGIVTRPRPLYPDNSRYLSVGSFAQGSYLIAPSLRVAGGVRFTGARFSTAEDRTFRIPRSSQWFSDVTFQSSAQWQLAGPLSLVGVVSRGFRAPNLNDLGALGLNDLGYEVPAAEAIPAGALLATDAGEGATSKGAALRALRPESLMNYEFGVRLRGRRAQVRVQGFDAELRDPITRRTLLFPAGAAPTSLAGLPVTVIPPTAAQRQQGVVTVATAADPRAVKAFVNDGQSRYYGLEAMGGVALTNRLSLESNYSYIMGRDLFPNRAIRRLPPAMGAARLRYTPGRRWPWLEVSLSAAAAQRRLSGGDRDDERIGASLRRADIASFFRGSRVAALTDSAGVFRPTGETLRMIQDRVLPLGATINGVRVVDDNSRAPLYLSTAGWATLGLRSGFALGERWRVNAALENALDRNYRYHGSGVDAPGVNAWVGLSFAF